MADSKKWLPAVGLILCMLLLQIFGPETLRYETDRIGDMQLWRMLTGHWVHANWIHYLMNMAGFLLCIALTGIVWSVWHWLWRVVLLSLCISLCFYIFNPEIGWYVGFSGVLFGLYVLAACSTLGKQVTMSSILLVFIVLKIVLEQWSSVKITSSELIGVPVLVDAHLYGVLIAVLLAAIQLAFQQIKQRNHL